MKISSNIAEGSFRSSKNDFARFIEVAIGSMFEVASRRFVTQRQQFLDGHSFGELYAAAEELSRMLSGLRKSLLSTLNFQQ